MGSHSHSHSDSHSKQGFSPSDTMSDWKYGFFDCLKPCNKMCCYACYCGPCSMYDMAEELEEGKGPPYLLLGLCFPLVPMVMLRSQAREKGGIEGSAVGDVLAACCCPACAHIQAYKQVNPQKSLVCGASSIED